MRLSIRLNDIHRSQWSARRLRARTIRKFKRKITYAAKAHTDFKPFIVRTWSGEGIGKAICVAPPKFAPRTLCFMRNRHETLSFMADLRSLYELRRKRSQAGMTGRRLNRVRRSSRRLPEFRGFIDFSRIEHIGTGAAVVLTALYDRVRKVSGVVPPTVNLDEWSDAAFLTLDQLGFFETVGHVVSEGQTFRDDGDVRTMAIMTGRNGTALQKACEAILDLSKFIDDRDALRFDVRLALNSALGEAMANVAAHAYPDDTDDTESVPENLRLWWVSASADRSKRILRVVAYDQGASIPVTLPRRTWAAKFNPTQIVAALSTEDVAPYPYDGDYIEFAMGEGRTQTGESGRGIGLPQMRDLVKICGAGSLTILSRGGVCCYRPTQDTNGSALPVALEGTLIEWEMQLPTEV